MYDSTDSCGGDQDPGTPGADQGLPESGADQDPSGSTAGQAPQPNQGPEEVRFLVDSTAGKLVRWLRLLGFDSTYSEQAADYRLVHRARTEGRIVLTRRRSAAALPWGNAVLLESDRLDDQLTQIARCYAMPGRPMTRCSLCNALLEDVSGESVRDIVPPFVYKTASGFSKCLGCGHVYWQGTHSSRITERWKTLWELAGSE